MNVLKEVEGTEPIQQTQAKQEKMRSCHGLPFYFMVIQTSKANAFIGWLHIIKKKKPHVGATVHLIITSFIVSPLFLLCSTILRLPKALRYSAFSSHSHIAHSSQVLCLLSFEPVHFTVLNAYYFAQALSTFHVHYPFINSASSPSYTLLLEWFF